MKRFVNGSIQLLWQLPGELQFVSRVSVDWGHGHGFVSVEPGLHFPAHFDPHREYIITLEFRVGSWVGYRDVIIPSVTSEDRDEGGAQEVGLIYGGIFGGLLVACSAVVVVILVLKYVQMTRRDEDKGSVVTTLCLLWFHCCHSITLITPFVCVCVWVCRE